METIGVYEIENYCSIQGYRIFYRIVGGSEYSKRAVLFLHNAGGHAGYLDSIIDNKLLEQTTFYALDLPGFGNSSGKRGHINSFNEYIKVIDLFVKKRIEATEGKELYIVGEGMGALLAFYYANEGLSPMVKGVSFMPGLYHLRTVANPFVNLLFCLLNITSPEFYIRNNIPISSYTNSDMFRTMLEEDRLLVKRKTVRLIRELKRVLNYLHRNIENTTVPLLIFHGEGDLYNRVRKSINVFARVTFSDERNRIVILENSNRWLLVDSDLEEIKRVLLEWMDSINPEESEH